MSKLGFMQDLIRGIKKLTGADEKKAEPVTHTETTSSAGSAANTWSFAADALVKRAFLFLEDGEFERADELCEQALNQDPENAMAYVGKVLVRRKLHKIEELSEEAEPLTQDSDFQKALRFADTGLKRELEQYVCNQAKSLTKKKKTRIVVLVVMLIVITVAASNVLGKLRKTKESYSLLEKAKVGDTVVFGSYEQDNNTKNGKEEIEWLVLKKTEDKILVISKYGLDCQRYNEEWDYVTWETCTLRKWLNDEFLNTAFTDKEQKRIPTVTVTAEDNPYCGTDAGNDTKDKVFLLSISEVEEYFADDAARMCEPTAYANLGSCWWWWLRSPGSFQYYAALVINDGDVISDGGNVYYYIYAVRPALWINRNP